MAGQPHILGHYKIERTLGRGAMGVVYEGMDLRLHRRVAIKTILKTEHADAMLQDHTSRFLREAQAVARLNHPNIVQVYDFGEEDDVSYIVMEFITGKDLKSHFDSGSRFDVREVTRIMGELLDALDFAHGNGVVHRDIKPANVMIDSHNRTKLTDFGVARLSDRERSPAEHTQAGTMVGTPAYMSPEQVLGQHIDHRTDIFSAGVLLYQMLTGQKPFEGGAFTVARKIVETDPPPPSTFEGSLSAEFDRIVGRAIAKSPDQRFARAREFAEALRRAVDRQPAGDFDDGATILGAAPPPMTASQSGARRVGTGVRQPPPERPSPPERPPRNAEADLEFWRSIKDSNDSDDMDFYIERFPEGIYVDLARRKLAKLRRGSSPVGADDSGTQTRRIDEEFWRAIKDTGDPDDISLYIEKFPQGLYVDLARRKMAKLRKASATGEDSGSRTRQEDIWRSISESTDPDDFHFYLEKFPQGAHAELAKRKIARLVGTVGESAWRIREDENKAVLERLRAEADAQSQAQERARLEAEEEARHEAEAKAGREAAEKARLAAAEKARREAEEKALREAQEKVRREAEERARSEAEAKARREAEDKARREAEAKARHEAEAKARREAEEKARQEAEARSRREAEEKARQEAEARSRREAEDKARLAAAEKARQEAEGKTRREAAEKARQDAEEKARREAAEKARQDAEEKARREAAEKSRREAEDRARRDAEEKARREAEDKARIAAEEKARREAAEKARQDAEEKARREAAEKSRREAEDRARRDAEGKARREAEDKARIAAEEKARREADEKARIAAQERALREAQEKARREAEEKARLAAVEKARRESEEMARREAQEKARRESEDRTRRAAEEKARKEAELMARTENARQEADQKAQPEAREALAARTNLAQMYPKDAVEPAESGSSQSRKGLAVGAAVVALLAVGAAIVYYSMPGDAPRDTTPAARPAVPAPATPPAREPAVAVPETRPAPPAEQPTRQAVPADAPATSAKSAAKPEAVPTPAVQPAKRGEEAAQRDARARRQAEDQQRADAARRETEEKQRREGDDRQRRETADKGRREVEDKARVDAARREADHKAALEAERRSQQSAFEEERRKLREEQARIQEIRAEQLKQQQEAEKRAADKQKADSAEEKQKQKVFVPPTF